MKIVMLTGKGISSRIVYNALSARFPIEKVLIEEPVAISVFLKKRIKRLGIITVLGQMLFKAIIETALSFSARNRIREIMGQFSLNDGEIDKDKAIRIDSANGEACISLLQQLQPDLVVVNGTRIISERVLKSVNAKFINMHAGITPKYRGVHGAYWALVKKDEEHCGVTVHFVDAGIDTGAVIYQTNIKVSDKDNFLTYPFLQTAYGLEIEKKAISDIIDGCVKTQDPALESKLYYHPTLWGYLKNLIVTGVK